MAFTWDQYQPTGNTPDHITPGQPFPSSWIPGGAGSPGAAPPQNGSSFSAPSNTANLDAYLNSGTILDPYTKEFTPPSAQDALNSPGLQYALSEALRTGQASAAAKGTLLNGRTVQGLEQNAIGTALQGYGDVYNRSLGQYLLGRDTFQQNQDRLNNKTLQWATLGKPVAAP